jgi:hypothetical protein
MTMFEQIKKAVGRYRYFSDIDGTGNNFTVHDEYSEFADMYFKLEEKAKAYCARENAIAVLKTMREPTDYISHRMLLARTYFDEHYNPSLTEAEAEAIRIEDHLKGNPTNWCKPEYRAAIDAILKEAYND